MTAQTASRAWDVNPPTVQDLLNEGWTPDGHSRVEDERPHKLDEDECWCNLSAARLTEGSESP